jgi:pyridinium-3,5-bisthiocarboxylic acid mononucleotide nickel chelatase
MKIAYFDCPSGVAGDMILGALVDAGASFAELEAELGKLRLSGYLLERREVTKAGFRATKVDVHIEAYTGRSPRNLRSILDILERSDLAEAVKIQASRVFTRLGEAEARVHGTTVDEVHFHELGAVDAIVDVTGACLGLHLLGVDTVHCSALPLGGGFVETQHGRIPVPGPATAELLKGFPVVDPGVKGELVTPTGAALLTTLAASPGSMPAMTVTAVGYGAGTMDLKTPNVIRAFIGETGDAVPTETVLQLETTVDDMSPQLYEPLMERLFEAGALDVYLTPVLMKKSRPGVVVTALCEPGAVTALARVCFAESTTIGVRWTTYRRERLPREMVTVQTSLGSLTFKVSRLDGRPVTVTPEFDDVRRIARDKRLTVREALDQARAEGRRLVR